MKTIEQLTQELEEVKKERDELKHKFVALQFDDNEAVPSEVNEAANYYCQGNMFFAAMKSGFIMGWKCTKNLSRLSSGETKVEELNCICSQGGLGFNIHNGIAYCKGCGYKLKETNSSNSEQENISSCSEIPNSSPCKHLHVSGTVCTDCGEFANPSEIPNSSPIPPLHPGSWTFPLFRHISSEHDKILTDSECMEIVEIVRRMDAGTSAPPESLTDKK